MCQKNGGIIVTGIHDADYVILFPPAGGSKTDKVHETFIGQAQATGLPAVSARFVHDCLEQHTILDTEPYQFTPASHKRKRTARSTSPVEPESEDEEEEEEDEEQKPAEAEPESEPAPEIDEAERKRLAKNLKERQRRQRIQNELRAFRDSSRPESPVASAGSSSQPSSQKKKRGRGRPKNPNAMAITSDTGRSTGPPSPTPPGEHTQVIHYKGFKFSPEEDAFAIAYGKVLVERNHEVSLSSVSNAIYKKVCLWYILCIVFCVDDRIVAAASYTQFMAESPRRVGGLRY